jgi:NAD(P)-dependent dehydrogenase (short-subunit alcohol dehydrogenase family)
MTAATKTLALVSAGPGLGLSLAQRFGAAGFQVALLARNPTSSTSWSPSSASWA